MISSTHNGSNQYFTTASALVSSSPFTISQWAYPRDNTTNGSGFCISDFNVSASYYLLYFNGAGAGAVQWISRGAGGNNIAASTTGYKAREWHHVCGVEETSSLRHVYLNGGSKGSNSVDNTPSLLDTTTVGALARASAFQNVFNGHIAHTCLWNVALNDGEVALLAQIGPNGEPLVSPFNIRPGNIVGYWPGYFNTTSGLIDYSGVGNTIGTVGGTPTPGPLPLLPPSGFPNGAAVVFLGGGAVATQLLLMNPPNLSGGFSMGSSF